MDLGERQKNKLISFLDREVKSIQKSILDLLEVLVPASNWKPVRSKVLDITNDFRRKVEEEVVNNYKIHYDPKIVCEDVIKVIGNDRLPLVPRQIKGVDKKHGK